MTFLGVAPWLGWTLFLLTLAAITIIFFLRIQHRQVVVSSALLWDRVLEKQRKRSWLELLRRLISLLIALLIGGSLVLAFTEAELGDGGPPRHVTLVIDNGLTMAAGTADGSTRLDRALERARTILTRGSGADTFMVTDRAGRSIAPASRDRSLALAALERLDVTSTPLQIPAAEPGGETWLITDGVGLVGTPDGINLISVYEPAESAGVSGFEIRATPTDPFAYEAFLEVGNFSSSPRQVRIQLIDESGVQFRRSAELQPNEFYRNTFDLTPLSGGPLEARVESEGDAYPLDDSAWIYLPRTRSLSVAVIGDGQGVVEDLLGRLERVEVTSMTAAEYEQWRENSRPGGEGSVAAAADPAGLDGLVFVGTAPESLPAIPALLLGPPAVEWLPARQERVEEPGPISFEAREALTQFVDLHDLRVDVAWRADAAGARVLLAAGDVPLILASPPASAVGDPEWVTTTFALGDSDLAESLAFPILLSNALDWWRLEAPMLRRLPGRVSLPMTGVTISAAQGAVRDVRTLDDRTVFTATEPGLYFARAGRRTVPVAVGLADRELSAVNLTILADPETPQPAEPPFGLLWPTLLALAATLLIVEGITYHRRITV